MHAIQPDQDTAIYTVSQFTREVKALLEGHYPFVWVEGEISNFAAPNSGHWYFCLKDANAQVRCAMFRGSQRKLQFVPKDGLHVLVKAKVSLYENRGEFQIIAEDMEERGEGKLRRAFEALQKKLAAQGLFQPEYKKPLPAFPQQVGIITSATGAAVRDILTVLKRRHASLPVIIYPTLVQGEQAAPNIVKAIETANRRNECDVLIVARGGGSLEDLWAFNEETVAQAIFQSKIPIISGVGHEVDFTIADFVADVRAPTPSAAAEMLSQDSSELLQKLFRHQQQLSQLSINKLKAREQQLSWMNKHLYQLHPRRKLQEQAQKLDLYEMSLVKIQTNLLHRLLNKTQDLKARLREHLPTQVIQNRKNQIVLKRERLQKNLQMRFERHQAQLAKSAARLNALSPLAVLGRGFAIASKQGVILKTANQVEIGDCIEVRLHEANLHCKILGKKKL